MVPAQAIIEQFEQAKKECQDSAAVRAWLPMLTQYGPDLLVTCRNASAPGEELVKKWLAEYMFREDADRKTKASKVAKWLSSHKHFKSHGRPIPRDALKEMGLNVVPLEDDQEAQDLFLSVFHAVSHTFAQTPAVKVIENHLGKAYLKIVQVQVVARPGPVPQGPEKPPGAQPGEKRRAKPAASPKRKAAKKKS